MKPVLSAKDTRQAELNWAERQDQGTWPLMEKAANSFVRKFLTFLQHKKVLVVAGPGNNGGDGYLIAKLLHEAGVQTKLTAPLGIPAKNIDADSAFRNFADAGLTLKEAPRWSSFDVIIDALFGSGLNRDLSSSAIEIVNQINHSGADVLSVDVPTGLNSQNGEPMPVAVKALATHSFIAFKPGTLTGFGPSYCGTVTLDSLNVHANSTWHLNTEFELPRRQGNVHKAQFGQILVIGGLQDMPGAAMIAGNAALRAGAGKVFLHCNPEYFCAAVSQTPELMLARHVDASTLCSSVVVAGPGMGQSVKAFDMMQQLLSLKAVIGVLDADALRYLAQYPQTVSEFVLTPHEGEAAALLGCTATEVRQNRVASALKLSQKFQTAVVLKGAGTLVAFKDRLTFCHPGTPVMSTPGMGDCLAGMIAALMAQGQNHEQAAINGVNWHGRIAASLAQEKRVVLASDVIRQLQRKTAGGV